MFRDFATDDNKLQAYARGSFDSLQPKVLGNLNPQQVKAAISSLILGLDPLP